jgi:hypothetical protein
VFLAMRGQWRPLLLAFLSLLGFFLVSANHVIPVHAAGLLYVSPASSTTASTGSTLSVQVNVANVDPFTGWDVEIRVDQAVLNPTGVSIDGNLLAANFSATMLLASDCVNGQGTGCGAEDGLGIIHSAAVALGTRSVPSGPTSGLLFTMTFTAENGGSGVSAIEVIRQVIVNGVTNSLIDVTVANGVYGSAEDFGAELSPLFGSLSQGNETMVNATIFSINGFTGNVNLTARSVLSAYVTPSSVFLAPDGSATAQIFASATLCDIPSSYSLSIVAASGSVSHEFMAFPNLVPNVSGTPDFCMTRFEESTSVNAGASGTVRFLLSSKNQFNGTVKMTIGVIPSLPNGPTVSLQSTSVTMYPGGFGSGQINISTFTSTGTGVYTMVVNATAMGLKHFLTEELIVNPPSPSISLTASSTTLQVAPESNVTDTITAKSLFGFAAPVALGTTISPFISGGLQVSLSVYTFPLATSINSTLTVSAPRGTALGLYNVTIFANGGGENTSITISVNVVPLMPPFFTQFTWDHVVSVGRGGVETFQFGIRNPNKNTPIFFEVQINGVDGSGIQALNLSTGPIQLASGRTLSMELTGVFSASQIGTTFSFSAMILWSTTLSALLITGSTGPGPPSSGVFTIVA